MSERWIESVGLWSGIEEWCKIIHSMNVYDTDACGLYVREALSHV
jgi:hypothetical protein